MRRLRETKLVERRIDAALQAAFDIPVGFAVAHKVDGRHPLLHVIAGLDPAIHLLSVSSFRDAPSWAQTRNPALRTVLDSGFARRRAPRNDGLCGWMRGSSSRMTTQLFL